MSAICAPRRSAAVISSRSCQLSADFLTRLFSYASPIALDSRCRGADEDSCRRLSADSELAFLPGNFCRCVATTLRKALISGAAGLAPHLQR